MPNRNTNQKSRYYQKMGWWPRERLELRYQRTVANRPLEFAVADSRGRELTHADLWQRSEALAAELSSRSVSKGDVVLLVLPNLVEWQVALLAILRLQAISASIPVTTDAKTLAYVSGLIASRLVLTIEDRSSKNLVDEVIRASEIFDGVFGIASISADEAPCWKKELPPPRGEAAVAAGIDHLMFTSSTTGLPKAVMHTTDTLAALNVTFTQRYLLGPDRPIFMGSPLGHSVGGIHGARLALHTGAALILQEVWEPQAALRMIDKYHCAFTAAATPFLKDLLEAPYSGTRPKMAPVSTFLCGGAPVPPALLEQSWEAFPETFVTNLWGMTEGGVVTCVPDSPKAKIVTTAGIGLPGLELQVLDEQATALSAGEEGELAMRGPGVFVGYCGQDDLYQSLLTRDGYFRTGDLAIIDDDGYVQITGRLKDLIIRGGVNISPVPTEDILSSHQNVKSIAVVGFPDQRLGERICAVVEPDEQKPTLEQLIAFASERGLPKRQWPEVVRYVRNMPRTAAGKIRKADLQLLIHSAGPDQLELDAESG